MGVPFWWYGQKVGVVWDEGDGGVGIGYDVGGVVDDKRSVLGR